VISASAGLGETMAVTMVIGNKDEVPGSVFAQGQSIASKIAVTFNESTASVGLAHRHRGHPPGR